MIPRGTIRRRKGSSSGTVQPQQQQEQQSEEGKELVQPAKQDHHNFSSASSSSSSQQQQHLIMRSLSLPFRIEEYAKEIRTLEARILSQQDGNMVDYNNSTSNHRKKKRLQRSMSSGIAAPDDYTGDAILLRKHILPHSEDDDTRESLSSSADFFVGEFAEDHQQSENDNDNDVQHASSSFLPSFEASSSRACFEDNDYDDMSASVRETIPFEPIVEENDEAPPALLLDDEKRKALETVEALAKVFELPLIMKDDAGSCSDHDLTRSPVSVRTPWLVSTTPSSAFGNQDTTPSSMADATNSSNNNEQDNDGSSSPRRSIFGSWQDGLKDAGLTWSAFGIFAMEDSSTAERETTNATAAATGNKTATLTRSPENSPRREFRLLAKGDRADSLPGRLPRKSSLKQIPCDDGGSVASGSRAANAAATTARKSLNRTVSFGKLETREYSIALSDHPSCSYGPPISLGWDFRDKESVALDTYEEKRSPRRSMHQMILSYNVRRYLLLKRAGYSNTELETAMQEVERVKRQRLVTDLLLPASKLDETVEDVVGHLKRMFGGKRTTA